VGGRAEALRAVEPQSGRVPEPAGLLRSCRVEASGSRLVLRRPTLVLLFVSQDGMKSLLRSKFEMGGDASVAAGPVGTAGWRRNRPSTSMPRFSPIHAQRESSPASS
jgi:hypothetical protein